MTRAVLTAAFIAASAVRVVYSQQAEPGAALDPALFSFQRSIPQGDPGVVALVIDPPALAHSRGPNQYFADVRVLDSAHRQVPYVIEHRDDPLTVPLAIERGDPPASSSVSLRPSNWSHYRLRLPCSSLPASKMVVETSARVFQRGVQLAVVRPADRHSRSARLETIAATTWGHVAPDEATRTLTLSVVPGDAAELWLSIDEGDNSALPITAVRLLLPSYRLRFYRPDRSALLLVYGRGDLAAPRYDLALVSRDVLNAEATEVVPLAERPTPHPQPLITPPRFWLFLLIAVAVLLTLIVRLARRRSDA